MRCAGGWEWQLLCCGCEISGAAGSLGAGSEGSRYWGVRAAQGPEGTEEDGAMRPCEGAATCGPSGASTLLGGHDSVGVLDWRRAKMCLWRECQGRPGGLLRPS